MLFLDYLLEEELQKCKQIIVYGTGYYAEQIYPMLCRRGLDKKMIAVAVSKGIPKLPFHHFQTSYIDEIGADADDVGVVIAVGEVHQDAMISNAREAGYSNIILLTDYIRTDANLMRYYQNLNYAQFCDRIIKRHVLEHGEKEVSEERLRRQLSEWESQTDFDKKQIVYLSGHFTPRSSKIIRALHRKGFQVVVILYGASCGEDFADEIAEEGISYIKCPDEESMTFCAMQYRPLAYYLEPKWGNCIWASFMISFKSHFRPIVLGLYDVLNDGYVIDDPVLLERERYALEHADGLVWRWFSKDYLEETKQFAYQGRSMQFHDYCGGYERSDKMEVFSEHEDGVLKLCSVQGAFWDFAGEGDLSPGQRGFASLKDIIRVLGNSKKCILHIYVGRYDKAGYEAGKEIENRISNIRFFWHVGHVELMNRLWEYDYGCEFYNEGYAPPLTEEIRYGMNRYYESVNVNSESNRFYDYLDANLPIVSIMPQKQMDFLRQYGAVVGMSLQNFDIEFLYKNKKKLKDKAKEAKASLTADRHISKMIRFFEEISDWKKEREKR